jgi:hypothetical protein
MASYQVFSEARGPHWIAWISRDAGGKPHQSVVLVAPTREEAEARARAWADSTAEDSGPEPRA